MNPIRSILVIVDPTAERHPAVDKAVKLAERFNARLDLFICVTKAVNNFRLAQQATNSPLIGVDFRRRLEEFADPLARRGFDITTEVVTADPLHVALAERVKHTCADLVVKDTHHHSLARRTFLTNTDWQLIRCCPVPLLLAKQQSWSSEPRICAAIDPGHADDKPRLLDRCILEQAAQLARGMQGQLHVAHVYIPAAIAVAAAAVPPLVVSIPDETIELERKTKRQELAALTSAYEVSPANMHLEVGVVSDMLCELAQRLRIDMMVMGAISRSGVNRILIGSTAETVLEQLPCDLIIVKAPNFSELLAL